MMIGGRIVCWREGEKREREQQRHSIEAIETSDVFFFFFFFFFPSSLLRPSRPHHPPSFFFFCSPPPPPLPTTRLLLPTSPLQKLPTSYLPVYLQDVLGLSNSKIGNLQAIAQFLCNASKSLSGTLADVLSPARMVIFGTLLTTLNKPMFAASGWVYASFGTLATLYWITAGKVFDRMSKGIREAPGKALIGDLAAASGDSPEGAFGLRQALATTGALLGSAIAGLAYKLSGQNYVLTFALAAAPAAAALVLTVGAFGPMAAESAAKKKKAAADEAAAVAAGKRRELFLFGLALRAREREREQKKTKRSRPRGEKKRKILFHIFFPLQPPLNLKSQPLQNPSPPSPPSKAARKRATPSPASPSPTRPAPSARR